MEPRELSVMPVALGSLSADRLGLNRTGFQQLRRLGLELLTRAASEDESPLARLSLHVGLMRPETALVDSRTRTQIDVLPLFEHVTMSASFVEDLARRAHVPMQLNDFIEELQCAAKRSNDEANLFYMSRQESLLLTTRNSHFTAEMLLVINAPRASVTSYLILLLENGTIAIPLSALTKPPSDSTLCRLAVPLRFDVLSASREQRRKPERDLSRGRLSCHYNSPMSRASLARSKGPSTDGDHCSRRDQSTFGTRALFAAENARFAKHCGSVSSRNRVDNTWQTPMRWQDTLRPLSPQRRFSSARSNSAASSDRFSVRNSRSSLGKKITPENNRLKENITNINNQHVILPLGNSVGSIERSRPESARRPANPSTRTPKIVQPLTSANTLLKNAIYWRSCSRKRHDSPNYPSSKTENYQSNRVQNDVPFDAQSDRRADLEAEGPITAHLRQLRSRLQQSKNALITFEL